jgi:folate-dependent phosphoribosylglycinamide formyltransferase PurN
MPETTGGIVVLTQDTESGRAVVNALERDVGGVAAIVEQPVPRLTKIRSRTRRLGPLTISGQILFAVGVQPLIRRLARPRLAEIIRTNDLIVDGFRAPVHRVESANDAHVHRLLKTLRPSVVVVSGTRILSTTTLASVDVPWINMHAGITPAYRGAHGGYWALVDRRPDLVGTTIHFVDAGVDTGPVIEQVHFAVERADSIATYPLLHVVAGLPALARAVRSAIAGTLEPLSQQPGYASRLVAVPTIWAYLIALIESGVR